MWRKNAFGAGLVIDPNHVETNTWLFGQVKWSHSPSCPKIVLGENTLVALCSHFTMYLCKLDWVMLVSSVYMVVPGQCRKPLIIQRHVTARWALRGLQSLVLLVRLPWGLVRRPLWQNTHRQFRIPIFAQIWSFHWHKQLSLIICILYGLGRFSEVQYHLVVWSSRLWV